MQPCVAPAVPGVILSRTVRPASSTSTDGSRPVISRTRRSQTISSGSPERTGSLTRSVAVGPRSTTRTAAGAVAVSGPTVPGRQKFAATQPRERIATACRSALLSRISSQRGSAARAARARREAPGIRR